MKKLLLSMLSVAAVAFASQAATEPLSIEFTKSSTAYESTSSYSSTWSSTDGNWEFHALNNNKCGWDFIAGGWKTDATEAYFAVKTASPAPVASIVATIGDRLTAGAVEKATLLVADNADFTAAAETDVTNLIPEAKNSDMTIDVTGAAAGSFVKVVFSIPKQSANGQAISFSKIVVNYGEEGSSDLKPAELAWSKSSFVLYESEVSAFEAPTLANPNNLPVTFTTSDENIAEVAADGAVTLSGDCGTVKISAVFEGNDEYKAQTVAYEVTVKADPTHVANIAETIALAKGTEIVVDYALTVGFVSRNNVFVCDEAGDFIQLYGSNTLSVGDVIPAGWNGVYTLYGTTPEIEFDALPATTAGTFTAKEVAAADITTDLVNSVVVVKDVVFAEATPATKSNFTGKVGDVELSFRNNYEQASVEAGTYDVTIVVTIFNNAPSLYVVSYAPAQSSGIEDIEAAEAEAVYYNLQGVRVDNPENGIFIVRRGDKVTKQVIR